MGEAAFGAISFFREREDIALELAKGIGIRAIARKLGRPPSTISREVRRNAATRSGNLDYRPVPPNGTPIVSPAGLLASWRSIRLCVNMLRSAWPAKSPTPMAPHSRAPRWVWKKRQSRRWSATWSPEQIAKSASDRLPRGSNHADQPRDDLSVLVSRTRSIAPRTDRMSAFRPSVARTARTGPSSQQVLHWRRPYNKRPSGRNCRSGCPRTLGRRPHPWPRKLGDRYARGTKFTLHNACFTCRACMAISRACASRTVHHLPATALKQSAEP